MAVSVLQVVQEFSREGGVETVAFELDAAFRAIGLKSSVMASVVPGGADGTDLRPVAPWLARCPTRGRWRYLGRMLVVPLFTLAATAAVGRARGGAVVLSHGDVLRGDIVVVHAIDRASVREKSRAGNYRWLLNPMHGWALARDRLMIGGLRYRRYVALSKRVADDLVELYKVPRERIRIIPNGINPARFAPGGEGRAAVREEFAVPSDAPLLLFVGHEFDRKGLQFVIEALASLDPAIRLLVVGSDNPDRFIQLAERLGVAGRVIFAGPRSDLPRCYRAADAFVLPTAYETFSLVCMEALASGVPVLATAVGGIEDYLEDGVNGFVIERDAASVAGAISRLFAGTDRLAAMRAAALDCAHRFSWEAVAKLYRGLIEEIDREKASFRSR